MKSKVILVPCDNYEEEKVYEAVKTGLDLLGGIGNYAGIDERVLVKANLLSAAEPDKAVTTHPTVFGAVLRCLREADCKVVKYGDAPGSPVENITDTAIKCGLVQEAEKYDVGFGSFESHHKVNFPQGKVAKSFELVDAVDEADTIIEVCKMKTHALENITGAVKNQYGFIAGAHKAKGHAMYPDSRKFAEMLVDLNKCVGVKLHIMDGIVAMEGNGPASGTPTPMNMILISEDPVALDTVFAKAVYLNPEFAPTCVAGDAMGLGTMKADEIEVVTPDGPITMAEVAGKFGNPQFDVSRKEKKFFRIPVISVLLDKFRSGYSDKPVVDTAKCVACGVCQSVCPVEGAAVHSGNGLKATYDYKKCIRCYCCQEMCPAKAIEKK